MTALEQLERITAADTYTFTQNGLELLQMDLKVLEDTLVEDEQKLIEIKEIIDRLSEIL